MFVAIKAFLQLSIHTNEGSICSQCICSSTWPISSVDMHVLAHVHYTHLHVHVHFCICGLGQMQNIFLLEIIHMLTKPSSKTHLKEAIIYDASDCDGK